MAAMIRKQGGGGATTTRRGGESVRTTDGSNHHQDNNSTYAHQEQLPSLPLPELQDTLDRYLERVRPFLSEEELQHTEAVISEFQSPGGAGPKLQRALKQRAAEKRNWLEEWWEQLAYMTTRTPSAILINWHGVLPGTFWRCGASVAEIGATFVGALLEQYRALAAHTYPVDRMGGMKLCMHQYRRMFASCRLPGENMDTIECYAEEKPRHIIVLRNNAIYSFDVLDEEGNVYPVAYLTRQFSRVMADGEILFEQLEKRPPAVSVLTADNRTAWYHARDHLSQLSEENERNLKIIQTSLFAVSLDAREPQSAEEVASHCLCADGRNKWYDKPFNLVVFANGRAGLNGEHSWADAIVVVNVFNKLLVSVEKQFLQRSRRMAKDAVLGSTTSVTSSSSQAMTSGIDHNNNNNNNNNSSNNNNDNYHNYENNKHHHSAAITAVGPLTRLHFKMDEKVHRHIERASIVVGRLIRKTDLRLLLFPHYGSNFMKSCKLNADFYVQMAIQLAYRRVFVGYNAREGEEIEGESPSSSLSMWESGKAVPTYETAHLRLFSHGRTETCQVVRIGT